MKVSKSGNIDLISPYSANLYLVLFSTWKWSWKKCRRYIPKKWGLNHHLEEELKVEEVIGRGGRGGNEGRDVSDVEFGHYSRRNGGPSRADCLVVLVVFLLYSALLLLRLSAFISSRGEGWHRYRLLRSKGFDSCGLLIRRHWNRNAALASCAIVGNFYLTVSSLICLLSSRIPLTQQREKIKVDISFFCFCFSPLSLDCPSSPLQSSSWNRQKMELFICRKIAGENKKKLMGGKKKKDIILKKRKLLTLSTQPGYSIRLCLYNSDYSGW